LKFFFGPRPPIWDKKPTCVALRPHFRGALASKPNVVTTYWVFF